MHSTPLPLNRFIDLSAIFLLASIACMIVSAVFIDDIDHFPTHQDQDSLTNGQLVLVQIAFWSVVVFAVTAALIWFYGLAWFWRNMPHHSFLKNAALLFLLLGFSWLAGLVIYFRERKRCKAPAIPLPAPAPSPN